MIVGVQIVSFAIVVTIVVNYFKNIRNFFRQRKTSLMSTKLFTVFLVFALLNIVFETISIYTIYYEENINPILNRICNQLYFGSMNFMIYFLFLYVVMAVRNQKRYHLKHSLLMSIPANIVFIIILFGNLEYHIGGDGRYSYGSMSVAMYLSITIYLLWMVILLIRDRKQFSLHSKKAIFSGIIIWCVIEMIQFLYSGLHISSMAVALMVQQIYISFENPRELIDPETGKMLNVRVFKKMFTEMVERRKNFYIVTITISNIKALKISMNNREISDTLSIISEKFFKSNGEMLIYRIKENVSCIILTEEELYCRLMKEQGIQPINSFLELQTKPKYFISGIRCPEYAGSVSDVLEMIDFICDYGEKNSQEGILHINNKFVEQKNYLKTVEDMLQYAISNDGFEVFYQPIYSTKKKAFVSAEALVRLKDRETLGFVSPEIFIPIAETNGIISELGDIVFRKVCEFSSENQLWKYGIDYIEINISGIQSVDERLPEKLKAHMDNYGINPRFINLEITETVSVEGSNILRENIEKLHKLGCSFSMDDFGTGYSNFSQMVETRFELIKFDKSLIWPAFGENSEKAYMILDSCIKMIHNLNMKIVAEGVETEEQVFQLTDMGVEYLQGYYFSKPLSETDYLNYTYKKSGII